MKGFRNRAAQKARKAATGGDGPPAGQDPAAPDAPAAATTADRGAMRKRLRRARELRDELVHDLGALVMEMHRQGRHDAALVQRKAQEAVAADAEVRALGGALDRNEPLAGGVTSPCGSCGALVAGTDSFCWRCGAAVAAGATAASPPAATPIPPPSPGNLVAAAPPSSGDRVEAAPPSSGDRVDAPPPSSGDRVDAPPPSPADRAKPPDDGVPTFTVNAP